MDIKKKKKKNVVGHRNSLWIARNPKWIFRLMSFYLGMILVGRSACQPVQQAEEPSIYMAGAEPFNKEDRPPH